MSTLNKAVLILLFENSSKINYLVILISLSPNCLSTHLHEQNRF